MSDEVLDTVTAPVAAPAAPAVAKAPAAPAAPSAPAAGPAADPPAEPKSDPADWRARALTEVFGEAKDDDAAEVKAEREKMSKLAGRYTSMGAALKALREAQVKISDGSLKAPLPKDPTPEQLSEYRKANGIPETPDKYDLGLPEGTVLGDDDQALLTEWVAEVHGANAPPAVVKAGAAALMKLRDAQVQRFADKDRTEKVTTEEALREEWGSDYRTNIDGVSSMLSQTDAAVRDTILNARGPDGSAIANNPAVLKWLAAHARELGFVGATVVPSGGDLGKSIDEELDGLRSQMSKDIDAWHKNAKGQKRFMELIEAQKRLKR